MGGGALATIGGMIAGAVGANALEHRHQKCVFNEINFFFSTLSSFVFPLFSPPRTLFREDLFSNFVFLGRPRCLLGV